MIIVEFFLVGVEVEVLIIQENKKNAVTVVSPNARGMYIGMFSNILV